MSQVETTATSTPTASARNDSPPGGAPFDGGGSPGDNLNNYNATPSTPLEIGLIVGVIAAVGLSAVALFFWRSRKNKALVDQEQQKEDAETGAAGSPTGSSEQHHVVDDTYHGHPVHERGGVVGGPPVPPPKDERRRASDDSDVVHNTSGITIERLSPRPEEASRTPAWSAWGHRNGGYNGAEEHEIVTRV